MLQLCNTGPWCKKCQKLPKIQKDIARQRQCYTYVTWGSPGLNAINEQFFNRTQNDVIWGLIALFLTNQNAGSTNYLKMNVIKDKYTISSSINQIAYWLAHVH